MRRAAALIVLLIAALLAWMVLGETEVTPEPAAPGAAAATEREIASESPRSSGPAGPSGPLSPTGSNPRRRKHATAPERDAREERAPEVEETERFSVRVVDARDRPVPGVAMSFGAQKFTKHNDVLGRITRSDGRTWVDLPRGSAGAWVRSPLFAHREIEAGETTVRLEDLIPLDVEFVDQETGRPLPVYVTGSPIATDDVSSHLLRSEITLDVAPVRAGSESEVQVWYAPPEGYTSRAGHPVTRSAFVSRYATAAHVTVQVPRELRLRVEVTTHDGKPAAGSQVFASVTGSWTASETVDVSASGTAVVEDLPFLRGEKLTLRASDGEDRTSPTESRILRVADEEIVVTLRLPEEPSVSVIGLGGGAGGSFSSRSRKRPVPDGTARIDATFARRNGLPAAGAFVRATGPVSRTGRADESGRYSFDRLPAGKYTIWLREPGLVTTNMDVEIADGEARTVALRETEGRAGTIRVVDHEGLPLPGVQLQVRLGSGDRYVQLAHGVQHLGHWTDIDGRHRLTDLPDGKVTVRARFGSRRVEGTLAGDTLRLVIPANQ